MAHRGLAHRDKSISPLPPAGTMSCGTVARQQLSYLTFISVREVDRCSVASPSSLSCSPRGGSFSSVSDVSFIRDIGAATAAGRGKSWVGLNGLTPEWEPPGGLVPTGRPSRARGGRRCPESSRLEGAFLRRGAAARLLPTADILYKRQSTVLTINLNKIQTFRPSSP